ncbi:MAG TPA: hypothetical protein PKD72_14685 [Gemmatales bacterium]|nr:hypothetical protein [Gemmatales bacterium]
MKLSEFYDAVSRKADTGKTKINVAETKRVLSEAFKILAKLDNASMLEVIARGLANAAKKS